MIGPAQELLIVGLGLGPEPVVHHHEEPPPVDPLERFRRPRLLDRDREREHHHHHECPPGEVVVRVLVRPVEGP